MESTTWTVILIVAILGAVLLGVAIALLVRLVRARRDLRRAGLPSGPRWVFWGPSPISCSRPICCPTPSTWTTSAYS